MRKLSEGNKSRFAIFALIIIGIIAVLLIVLTKALSFEKESYAVSKDVDIYDVGYEYINLTSDAVIEKKWTGEYYLTESETNLSYELGNTAIAYDSLKKRVNLYGTFYEIALDGETSKTSKYTEVSNVLEPKLYKIEDRKYLIVADNISNEKGTLTANNYLIVVIDKSGNTRLLNNEIDIKTINAIILETDTFKFDVANEKLIYESNIIDLKKIIGSSNQYVKPVKNEENTINANEVKEEVTTNNGGVVANGGTASSTTLNYINVGGGTTINVGNTSGNNNTSNSGNNVVNNNSNSSKNTTNIQKSVSLRSVSPGETYLDVNYSIVDPENEYQVVYLLLTGGGKTENISLDKNKDSYRIIGLKPNTDYKLVLGYKEIKKDATVEEITEDTINVKTLKVEGSLSITKVTEDKVYFNLKLDKNSSYDNAKIYVYVNNNKQDEYITVDTEKALQADGWTSSLDITEEIFGKITLSLGDVKELELTSSAQIN